LYFNEETSWEHPILTCNNGSWQLDKARGSFYTWTNNKLQIAKIRAINMSNWIRSMVPMTFDQKTVFVGRELTGERKVNDHSFYDTMIFNLIQPPLSKEELEAEKIAIINKNKKVLSGIKASDAFDGKYWFDFKKIPVDGKILEDGSGYLLINQGIAMVKKGSKGGYDDLGQVSRTFFDSFEGRVDKNGNIIATFNFSLCGHCGLPEKTIVFSGNISSNKLSGMYDDIEVYFDVKEK